jgi:hypothetical protein
VSVGCKHKFYDYLHLKKLDFEPKTLIIGTFNPEWPEDNYAEWFYGRTSNNYFWDVLPRMHNQPSLRKGFNHHDWKNFCSKNKVAITDIIADIKDADKLNSRHFEVISKFDDKEFASLFNAFERTGIVQLLKAHNTIEQVYFTRQKGVDLFDTEVREIEEYCKRHGIYFSHLITPSASARFQMKDYVPSDASLERSLANFIYEKWLEKRNEKI